MGIVETKVRVANSDAIKRSIFRHWRSFDNYLSHPLGRIWVGWKLDVVEVAKVEETDQMIYCSVVHLETRTSFFVSFLYALDEERDRRLL